MGRRREDDFGYYCKFCRRFHSFDESSSCQHAIYHFATVGIIIYFNDSLRKLLVESINRRDDVNQEEDLKAIAVSLDENNKHVFHDYEGIYYSDLFFSPWDTLEVIEKYIGDIHKIAPSFIIDGISGIEGEIDNYIGLANLRDIKRLEVKYKDIYG